MCQIIDFMRTSNSAQGRKVSLVNSANVEIRHLYCKLVVVVGGVVLVTAVSDQSATDYMLNEQEGNTTCSVTRLQNCMRSLTSYLTVDELHAPFPVYSHTVLDTVCKLVLSLTCYMRSVTQ